MANLGPFQCLLSVTTSAMRACPFGVRKQMEASATAEASEVVVGEVYDILTTLAAWGPFWP